MLSLLNLNFILIIFLTNLAKMVCTNKIFAYFGLTYPEINILANPKLEY